MVWMFLLGLFVGANFAVVAMAMLIANRDE